MSGSRPGVVTRLDLHHRKEPYERGAIPRQQARGVLTRQRVQIAAEAVDHAVEALVWNRLVLVASAAQSDDGLSGQALIEEALHQRALADP